MPARRPRRARSRAPPRRARGSASTKCRSRADRDGGRRRTSVASGSRMLARSKPWRTPRAVRAIERAFDLLLQVEDRVVALARAASRRNARDLAPGRALRAARGASAASANGIDAPHVAGTSATQRRERLLGDPVDRECRARARATSATSASACTTSPSDEGRTTSSAAHAAASSGAQTHVEFAATRDASPSESTASTRARAHGRAASPVARGHHPRRRARARGVPRVRAVRRGDASWSIRAAAMIP